MREIKFRVWDLEKKRMSLPMHHTDPVVKWSDGDIDMPAPFANNPDRFVWLQFTGYRDNKKEDVYDGDIINPCNAGEVCKVWWDGLFGQWKTMTTTSPFSDERVLGFYRVIDAADGYKIIGNIYENPELLK